jgi:hypothetical protein
MQRGDKVKFVVNFLNIISIVEEEGLVVAKPAELTTDAIRQDITMHTRFKLPMDYVHEELGAESENDLIDLTLCRYYVCIVQADQILIQDEYNGWYLKVDQRHLIY